MTDGTFPANLLGATPKTLLSARVSRASIRDDKADIQILRKLGELRDEALLREVHRNNAMLNFKIFRDTASIGKERGWPPARRA